MCWIRLLVSDFVASFMWVWSSSILKYLVYAIIGLGMDPLSLLLKSSVDVVFSYGFSRLRIVTEGASYNPLMVLCYAMSENFIEFVFTVFARIPSQVIGSIFGVWFINTTFPAAARGPNLAVDVPDGEFTEGLLAFLLVTISLGLKNIHKSSSEKAWISSISKVVLQNLASERTGGVMNPASAFGWAYARGQHLTKEHLSVYWFAPMEAAMLGVWACSSILKPQRHLHTNHIKMHLKVE